MAKKTKQPAEDLLEFSHVKRRGAKRPRVAVSPDTPGRIRIPKAKSNGGLSESALVIPKEYHS